MGGFSGTPEHPNAEPWAHTPPEKDPEKGPHLLRDHLLEVARLAGGFAAKFGARDLGYAAGLLHDVGKYNPEFQKYLRACVQNKSHERVPHSTHGAFAAQKANLLPLIFAIAGHHCGLQNKQDVSDRLKSLQERDKCLVENAICWLGISLAPSLPSWLKPTDALSCEFLTRMLFSALADADRLDTERHWGTQNSALRGGYPDLRELWVRFQEYHQREIAPRSLKNPSPVNKARGEVYQACLEAAEKSPGVFRLTVPTGGGKTLSGMAFALRHAIIHNLDRVIVAVPYTTIIDQTADEYRRRLSDRASLTRFWSTIPR